MKKLILPLLLLSVVLAGCGTNQATFEQKQECANYRTTIVKELNIQFNGFAKLMDLFYSPTKDTCILWYNGFATDPKDKKDMGYTVMIITDYLTNKLITKVEIDNSSLYGNDNETQHYKDLVELFNKQLKDLKGE